VARGKQNVFNARQNFVLVVTTFSKIFNVCILSPWVSWLSCWRNGWNEILGSWSWIAKHTPILKLPFDKKMLAQFEVFNPWYAQINHCVKTTLEWNY